MDFNDLLKKQGIPQSDVLLLRHRPKEPKLREVLQQLAAERPDLYNAYQQTQYPKVEKAMIKTKYVASFIGVEPRTALFAGLYEVKGWRQLDFQGFWKIAANKELHESFGMVGLESDRPDPLWFDLSLDTKFYPDWRGRLIIRWPVELAWWRRAERNVFEIYAIRESIAFEKKMPSWDELVIDWPLLKVLSPKWQASLKEWRGIYYIYDSSDGRGYVGAAYGADNILGRWRNYGASGHGGNKKLRKRDPKNFRFSILQRVSPDMPSDDVQRLEQTWKSRLHTRHHGLNEN